MKQAVIPKYEQIEFTTQKYFDEAELDLITYVFHNQSKTTSLRIWSNKLEKQIGTVYTRQRDDEEYVTFTYKAFENLDERSKMILLGHFKPKMDKFIKQLLDK